MAIPSTTPQTAFRAVLLDTFNLTIPYPDSSPEFWPAVVQALGVTGPSSHALLLALATIS